MSADTATVSPTTRFAGYRPPSTPGLGYWIWIRGGGCVLDGSGTTEHRSIHPTLVQNPPAGLPRSSGVQLHPTSLPSARLDRDAYRFVDWLASAGQTWWQVLPLGPPDRHRSPYKARSAFAGWPGLLAEPRARVSKDEELDFRERHSFWIDDWSRVAGRGAVADQVRFEREWLALRSYAGERGVGLFGDM